jgi:hypothetical protein
MIGWLMRMGAGYRGPGQSEDVAWGIFCLILLFVIGRAVFGYRRKR